MAYPDGRLLAVTGTTMFVLAADGWTKVSGDVPRAAEPISAREAGDWCARRGWDAALLTGVPG